ncbi:monoacylglycerol lipase ABHD2 [Lepeophtheirus salmonis]|nr:monoacylglycerol lipase ABHD2-like [Lepeophtheirus salmonis]
MKIFCRNENRVVRKLKTLKRPLVQFPFNYFSTFSLFIKRQKYMKCKTVILDRISIDIYDNCSSNISSNCNISNTTNTSNNTNTTNNTTTTVILVHGFSSDSKAYTVISTVEQLSKKYRCIAINYRGSLKLPLKCHKFTHIGFTDDIIDVLTYCRQKYPKTKFVLVGFSLGGHLISLLLGRDTTYNENNDIIGGVAISAPTNFKICCDNKNLYTNFIDSFFLNSQKNFFARNKKTIPKSFYEKAMNSKSVVEMNRSISEFFCFDSLADYYRKNSCEFYMKNIEVPYLIINSYDDFVIGNYVPIDEVYRNSNIICVMTNKGGHLGFLDLNLKFGVVGIVEDFINNIQKID